MKRRLAVIASLLLASSVMVLPVSASVNNSVVASGTLGEQGARSTTLTMGDATFTFPVQYFIDRGFVSESGVMNSTIKFVMDSTGTEVVVNSSTSASSGSPYYVISGETIVFHTGKVAVINGESCRIEAVQSQSIGGISVNKTTVVMNYSLEVVGSSVSFSPIDDGSDFMEWESTLGDVTTIEPVMDVSLANSFSDVVDSDGWFVLFQYGDEGQWFYTDVLDLVKDSNGKWTSDGEVVEGLGVTSSSDHVYSAILPEGVTTCYYGFKSIHTGEWCIPYEACLEVAEDGKSASTSTTGYSSNMMKLYCDSSLEGKRVVVSKKIDGQWVSQPLMIDSATKETYYGSESLDKSGEYFVLDSDSNGSVKGNSLVTMYIPTLGEMKVEVYDEDGKSLLFSEEFTVSNVLHSGDGQFVKPNVTVSCSSKSLKVTGLSTDSSIFYSLSTDGSTKPTEGFQNATSSGTLTFSNLLSGTTYYLWRAQVIGDSAVIDESPLYSFDESQLTSSSESGVVVRYYSDDEAQNEFVAEYGETLREVPTGVIKWSDSSSTEPIVTTEATTTTLAPVVVTDENGSAFTKPNGETVTVVPSVVTDESGQTVTGEDGSVVTTVPSLEYTPDYESRYDLTGDGVVDSLDVLLLKKFILGGASSSSSSYYYDVNGDGYANIADVCTLKSYMTSLGDNDNEN